MEEVRRRFVGRASSATSWFTPLSLRDPPDSLDELEENSLLSNIEVIRPIERQRRQSADELWVKERLRLRVRVTHLSSDKIAPLRPFEIKQFSLLSHCTAI